MEQRETPASKRELDMLELWERERVFERSLERDAPHGEYIFYEGPPTANAPPALHHVIGRTFKDVIPRFKTMRGYRVRRKAGWDTHGLPVELQIEKQLGLSTKHDIEVHGIAAFNAQCRDSVWAFKGAWDALTKRIGFWLDLSDPYITYEMPYIESVWWFLRQAHERGLLARDHKIVPWCPRCETPLSSHEVAQGYEDDVEDPSVTVCFPITHPTFDVPRGAPVFALVWTTTPWTLPANGALAVAADGAYAVVRHGERYFLLAAPLVARVLGDGATVVQELRGRDLVGLRYEPLYPRIDVVAHPSAYQVLDADFVSFDDGTGIVHIAPAYGEDDFQFTKRGIPVTYSVDQRGIMAAGLPGAGLFAKDADAAVREELRQRGLLFRDEKTRHTYPFCWRCKSPLLYFARASWYITMSKLRPHVQALNGAVGWHPEHIKDGRMGEWLRELKDWAITRERYWGAPLPIWQCDACGTNEVLGSFAEVLERAPQRNTFLMLRHATSTYNGQGFTSTVAATAERYPLTEEGRAMLAATVEELRGAGITKIVASPFRRTRETAEIVGAALGVPVELLDALRELDLPEFDGKPQSEYHAHFGSTVERFTKKVGTNETWEELAARMVQAVAAIDAAHEGETVLLVSHGDPLYLLRWALSGMTRSGIEQLSYPEKGKHYGALPFSGALVNHRGELDMHRPFIDAVSWRCASAGCAGTMRRYPEVADVWLESGCMPFAQHHYPFEQVPEGLADSDGAPKPAAYIAEAIDQTRGWFYTLLAVASVLGKQEPPFAHCIVYSHILDRAGKKMSKSRGNIVDPNEMIERYGVDVVRWYMLAINQPWDSKLFDENDLKLMSRKPFGTLMNVLSFWQLHGDGAKPQWVSLRESGAAEAIPATTGSGALLDAWLRARFASLHRDVTQHLDAYRITEAARALEDAIDDLSTWWLRRSRERLKAGDASARQTFTAALETLAVLMAPFAPFTAEHLWQALHVGSSPAPRPRGEGWFDSVHLASWDAYASEGGAEDDALRTTMDTTRAAVRIVLEARSTAGVPVRQPLASAALGEKYHGVFHTIVADETNVKVVQIDPALDGDAVRLDTALSPELQREGMARELIRKVNGLRKEMGLTPSDRIRVAYATADATLTQAIAEHRVDIERGTVSVLSPSSRGGADTPAAHHDVTISGVQIVLAMMREE
ncbi:MAG: class I tRNA ligase family protein [bacterium]|nr:class I tRNA ligase family protein [bacterium]